MTERTRREDEEAYHEVRLEEIPVDPDRWWDGEHVDADPPPPPLDGGETDQSSPDS